MEKLLPLAAGGCLPGVVAELLGLFGELLFLLGEMFEGALQALLRLLGGGGVFGSFVQFLRCFGEIAALYFGGGVLGLLLGGERVGEGFEFVGCRRVLLAHFFDELFELREFRKRGFLSVASFFRFRAELLGGLAETLGELAGFIFGGGFFLQLLRQRFQLFHRPRSCERRFIHERLERGFVPKRIPRQQAEHHHRHDRPAKLHGSRDWGCALLFSRKSRAFGEGEHFKVGERFPPEEIECRHESVARNPQPVGGARGLPKRRRKQQRHQPTANSPARKRRNERAKRQRRQPLRAHPQRARRPLPRKHTYERGEKEERPPCRPAEVIRQHHPPAQCAQGFENGRGIR